MSTETASPIDFEAAVETWLPEVLDFSFGNTLESLRSRFILFVSERWGGWIGALTLADHEAGERLQSRISDLPLEALCRILLAPESIRRLLWASGEPADREESVRFFVRAVEVERASCGLDHQLDDVVWSAMGDRHSLSPDPHTTRCGDLPRLVIGDPATKLPSTQPPGSPPEPWPALPAMVARLQEAQALLRATDPKLADFARDWNTTLVLRHAPSSRGFQSSSPERYVGRSILWDMDDPAVGTDALAEAMIHEGLHTVFDMADAMLSRVTPRRARWVTDPSLYDGVSRTVSPWTGSRLDVPTYVHAFLVWFGLLGLWAKVASRGTFEPQVARKRLLRAGVPFATRTAFMPLEPFAEQIRPDVRDLLRQFEDQASQAFDHLAGEEQ
ncbi:hypothetical protein [Sphingomonas pituitosa]|uniref:hypothetical protein n=1 Tax=Sphingomonas pituitosa TaxID=99597 RepID=UPI000836F3BA|nr:hypothetical protein [Sphingomonas pituitosa]